VCVRTGVHSVVAYVLSKDIVNRNSLLHSTIVLKQG